jgi:bleomycin hydrolase
VWVKINSIVQLLIQNKKMKKITLFSFAVLFGIAAIAQTPTFQIEKVLPATSVKNQANTGTCWCFSGTSLVESQCMKNGGGELDLSEMFTVRNIYMEKAHNYILRQGHAQFGEGGLGHDLIRAMATYGAEPESAYSGLLNGQKSHDHQKMSRLLKNYLDSVLKLTPVPTDWMVGYKKILDDNIGVPPEKFTYNGKEYTPKTFAKEVVKFNPDDYVFITSFTHHPYYSSFILEVPDNFSNGSFFNVPVQDMIDITKSAINKGYSISWDADVSNSGFNPNAGTAINIDKSQTSSVSIVAANATDSKWSTERRQELFENLTTQDDHLMHITGLEKATDGQEYFLVKNSWGAMGATKGYINVSENYFAINTISLVIPRAALSPGLLEKMKK